MKKLISLLALFLVAVTLPTEARGTRPPDPPPPPVDGDPSVSAG